MAAEVLENLRNAIIEGKSDEAINATKQAITDGLSGDEILQQGLIPGIRTVGELYGEGEYYLPELLMSGKAMEGAIAELDPLLSQGKSFHVGKYVIGTVKGDIHDIGKNIIIMMLKGNGWEVTDLGVDVTPDKFCEALKEADYDILGMSTLLTVTMPAAGETIEAIKEAGLRDDIKIMIGGAPVTQEFSDKIGADDFAVDAWEAITKAQRLIEG